MIDWTKGLNLIETKVHLGMSTKMPQTFMVKPISKTITDLNWNRCEY